MRWLDHSTDSMDMSLSKFWETVKDREPWGFQGGPMSRTQLSNRITTTFQITASTLDSELMRSGMCLLRLESFFSKCQRIWKFAYYFTS